MKIGLECWLLDIQISLIVDTFSDRLELVPLPSTPSGEEVSPSLAFGCRRRAPAKEGLTSGRISLP